MYFFATFYSICLYGFRQRNMENILKIIFNLGGFLFYASSTWYYFMPRDIELIECKANIYSIVLANIIYKSALAAFLLWRLYHLRDRKIDWPSILLFFIRLGFHVSIFYFLYFCG